MAYSEFFRGLTGYSPYAFQESIGGRILAGESLVFRAPTGAGKTWTTVAPYLYSLEEGGRLADRLIYALPLRSLASGLHETVASALDRVGVTSRSGKGRSYSDATVQCSLQMGGEKNDPFLEGDLIFCTIDQLLSGYLMMPISLPSRLDNMVAGALPGSLVIFDEAHLLDSGIALGTVIEMLVRLKGLVQFVIMTATMSDDSLRWLAKKLGAGVAELAPSEIRQLPVQATKQRVWNWNAGALEATSVRSAHGGGRTLVIVNQTGRAQDLHVELEEAYKGSGTRVACLHSRFFPGDRKHTEDKIQAWFGRNATDTDVILVSTQVVEAGIDISADHILTELAPMNSLVQRAGRTARYVERSTGIVTVFDVATTLPYKDNVGIAKTRECLTALKPEGESVDFEREQVWGEFVHAETEKAALLRYANLKSRQGQVQEAILFGHRGYLSALVREIDAVNILLTDDPNLVEFDKSRWPSLLSIPRNSVWKLRDHLGGGTTRVWMAKSVDDESGPLRFQWEPVVTAPQLAGAWLIALGSAVASYSKSRGLRIGLPGEPVAVQYDELAPTPRYQYYFETWIEHISRVLEQCKAMSAANAVGARRLDRALDLEAGTCERLVEKAVALHDAGKLAEAWQDAAWNYETGRTGMARGVAIAHTTKTPGDLGPKMPPHAVEGAFAAFAYLDCEMPDAALAVTCAIARHHSARAKEGKQFHLIPEANELVAQMAGTGAFVENGQKITDLMEFASVLDAMWEDDAVQWWPVYAYIARRLRLADQAGTAAGVREGAGKHDSAY